LRLLNNGFVQV
jgi:hypothetical protein